MQVRAGSRSAIPLQRPKTRTPPAPGAADTHSPIPEATPRKAHFLQLTLCTLGGDFCKEARCVQMLWDFLGLLHAGTSLKQHTLSNMRTGHPPPPPTGDRFWSTLPDTAKRQ